MWGKKQKKKAQAGTMPVYFRWAAAPYLPYKDFGIFTEYWPVDNHCSFIALLIEKWQLYLYIPGVATTLF